jgi:hypothetical protein
LNRSNAVRTSKHNKRKSWILPVERIDAIKDSGHTTRDAIAEAFGLWEAMRKRILGGWIFYAKMPGGGMEEVEMPLTFTMPLRGPSRKSLALHALEQRTGKTFWVITSDEENTPER